MVTTTLHAVHLSKLSTTSAEFPQLADECAQDILGYLPSNLVQSHQREGQNSPLALPSFRGCQLPRPFHGGCQTGCYPAACSLETFRSQIAYLPQAANTARVSDLDIGDCYRVQLAPVYFRANELVSSSGHTSGTCPWVYDFLTAEDIAMIREQRGCRLAGVTNVAQFYESNLANRVLQWAWHGTRMQATFALMRSAQPFRFDCLRYGRLVQFRAACS